MSDEARTEDVRHRRATFRQYLAAFVVNISAFSNGTVIGWTSPMQPLLSSENTPVGTEAISTEIISWLGSINYIGAIVGSLFWGISVDRLGRKNTAIIVAIPLIVSWTLKLTAQNVWWLIVARVIAGIGCSGVVMNTPMYVAEIAEDKIRGSLGSFLVLFMIAGRVFSNVFGSLTSYHTLTSVCLCVPIIYLVCIIFMPESPIYLWTQGKTWKAEKSLVWLRGGNTSLIIKEVEVYKTRPNNSTCSPSFSSLFSSKGVRKAMVISIVLIVSQELCGILAILTFTLQIIRESGSSLSEHNILIVFGVLQLFSALISSALVDHAGRRFLLLSSFIVLGVSLSALGGYLYIKNYALHPMLQWIPILCISTSVISYSMGVGPVPFVVISEIFAPNIRGFAISKILILCYILSFCSIKTFPILTGFIGSHGCFLVYGIICAISSVLIFLLVPETKNLPLKIILMILNGEQETFLEISESSKLISSNTNGIVRIQTT